MTGFGSSLKNVANMLAVARYDRWRDYDPADSLRFYALRLQELGFLEKGPNDIIDAGTDLRFVNEIKRELKS